MCELISVKSVGETTLLAQLIIFPIIMEGNKRLKVSHHHDADLDFAQIGAGTFQISSSEDILCALRIGYKHIDLAETYGNLKKVNTALKHAFLPLSEGGLGIERKSLFITMKVHRILSNYHISDLLKIVGVDFFDLLLYHSPGGHFTNKKTMEKNWRKLIAEKDSGKVCQIGVSNFYKQHLDRLLVFCNDHRLQIPFANQILINPYVFPKETINFCKYWNIKVIAYCPLGFSYCDQILSETNVKDIALQIGCSPSQVVLSWLLKQGIHVIPRSSNEEHLKSNLDSKEVDWQMNKEKPEFEEMMQSLQKSNDEVFGYMIDISIDAFCEEIMWGTECSLSSLV